MKTFTFILDRTVAVLFWPMLIVTAVAAVFTYIDPAAFSNALGVIIIGAAIFAAILYVTWNLLPTPEPAFESCWAVQSIRASAERLPDSLYWTDRTLQQICTNVDKLQSKELSNCGINLNHYQVALPKLASLAEVLAATAEDWIYDPRIDVCIDQIEIFDTIVRSDLVKCRSKLRSDDAQRLVESFR